MDSYENYDGGDQEMVPPVRSPGPPTSKPPGPPPPKPPGPPPSRPPGPPGSNLPPGPPSPAAANPFGDGDEDEDEGEEEDFVAVGTPSPPPPLPRPTSGVPPGPPRPTSTPPRPPGPPSVKPSTAVEGDQNSEKDEDEDEDEGRFVSVAIPNQKHNNSNSNSTSTSPLHADSSSNHSVVSGGGASSPKKDSPPLQDEEEEEEREDSTTPEVRCKENMTNTRGLIGVTRSHTEIPSEMLARYLLKGEVVTGQFDFFYPRKGFSTRFKYFLTFITLGLYMVFVCLRNLVGVLRRLLFPCKACKDPIHLRRGKMVVTNKGRIICWQLEVAQHNSLTNVTTYRVAQNSHILNADDVAQITLSYSDKLMCLGCCCGDFVTGIDVCFNAFDHHALPRSRYLYTNHPGNYLLSLSSYIKGSVAYSVYNSIAYGSKESLVLRVVSSPQDRVYDGEYGLEPLEDLCKLNEALCNAMSNRAPHYPGTATVPLADGSATDAVKRNAHAFLSARAVMDVEVQKQYGVDHVHLAGVKEQFPDLTNFTLVDEDGNVTVPSKWIALTPGESIVSAVGQYYKPTCCEIVLSVATLGLYYLRFVRSKLFERSAVILTTHRVVEVLLFQARGKVPAELGSVDVVVRSYFPKQVQSGYIRSGDGYSIECAIYSTHGQLVVSLPSTQLQFAQKMQLVAAREAPLDLREVEALLPDISHLNQTPISAAMRRDDDGDEDHESSKSQHQANLDRIKFDDSTLSPVDQILLPLMPGETLLHRFQGGAGFKPCCLVNFGCFKSYLCSFAGLSPNQIAVCGVINCVKLLTCGWRPLLTTPTCVVTSHSLYYVANTTAINVLADTQTIGTNYAGCCGAGYRLEPFILTWLPIRKLKDHSVQVEVHGTKPFGPLLCCLQTPKSKADRYSLSVNSSEGISYPLTEDMPFKSWTRDARLAKMQNTLGAIQTIIAKE